MVVGGEGQWGPARGAARGRGWRVAQVVLLIYGFLTFPTQGGLQSGCNSGFLKLRSGRRTLFDLCLV